MFDCIEKVLSISNLATQIWWISSCILTFLAMTFSFTFFYNIIKYRSQQRATFAILLVTTIASILCNTILLLPSSLYYIELFRLRRNDVDPYDSDAYEHEYIHSDCQLLSSLSSIFYNSSYVCMTLMYFYRLKHLFSNTMYPISKYRTRLFIILVLLLSLCFVVQSIFIFTHNLRGTFFFLLSFLLIYFVTSFYLVWNLNKQATTLRNTLKAFTNYAHAHANNNYNVVSKHLQSKSSGQYVKTMKNLSLNNTSTESCDSDHDDARTSSDHDNNYNYGGEAQQEKIEKLTKVFVRLVLLAYISIFSTVTLIVVLVLMFTVMQIANKSEYAFIADLAYFTLTITDNLINILCVALQFEEFGYFNCIYKHCCQMCEKNIKLMHANNSECGQNKLGADPPQTKTCKPNIPHV